MIPICILMHLTTLCTKRTVWPNMYVNMNYKCIPIMCIYNITVMLCQIIISKGVRYISFPNYLQYLKLSQSFKNSSLWKQGFKNDV